MDNKADHDIGEIEDVIQVMAPRFVYYSRMLCHHDSSSCIDPHNKFNLVGSALFVPKETSNAIKGVLIPRPPPIKSDMDQSGALLEDLNNACLMPLKFRVDQCPNCGIRDIGVHDPNCRIQIFEDISCSTTLKG